MVKRQRQNEASTTREWLLRTLGKVKTGEMSPDDALRELSVLPYEDLGFAKVDHHRRLRTGFPEVVLGRGKTAGQITAITERLASHADKVLVTHASPEAYDAVRKKLPETVYTEASRTIVLNRSKAKLKPGVAVVSGGTSDIPVAEEAAVTAELMGNEVDKIYDVGVAGLHRLLDKMTNLTKAKVLVVVAGMEGALPSVVGGLVSAPVIAVPTSIGYGASFNGLAALLAMLNSCAPGVAVVNIDNGFGAGYLAGLINLQRGE
jgi:pyridinium-3,5-biscarboxylic acid mononucleotide synthase